MSAMVGKETCHLCRITHVKDYFGFECVSSVAGDPGLPLAASRKAAEAAEST
jgi:hypothetical protein